MSETVGPGPRQAFSGVLHVESVYPAERDGQPPLLFVHGAASGAWVWRNWLRELGERGWEAHALDLRGHGESGATDLAGTGMNDYTDDIERVVGVLRAEPALVAWSMGGLVAQQYAASHPSLPALVLISPSPPLAVQGAGSDGDVAAIPDRFGLEYYGLQTPESARRVLSDLTPAECAWVLAHPGEESGRARRERKRGIDVDAAAIHCPLLLISGERDRHFPPTLCRAIAAYYGAEYLSVAGARHWGPVVAAAVVADLAPRVDQWLRRRLPR